MTSQNIKQMLPDPTYSLMKGLWGCVVAQTEIENYLTTSSSSYTDSRMAKKYKKFINDSEQGGETLQTKLASEVFKFVFSHLHTRYPDKFPLEKMSEIKNGFGGEKGQMRIKSSFVRVFNEEIEFELKDGNVEKVPLWLYYLYRCANFKDVYIVIYNDSEFTILEKNEVELLMNAQRKNLDELEPDTSIIPLSFRPIKNLLLPLYIPDREVSKVSK